MYSCFENNDNECHQWSTIVSHCHCQHHFISCCVTSIIASKPKPTHPGKWTCCCGVQSWPGGWGGSSPVRYLLHPARLVWVWVEGGSHSSAHHTSRPHSRCSLHHSHPRSHLQYHKYTQLWEQFNYKQEPAYLAHPFIRFKVDQWSNLIVLHNIYMYPVDLWTYLQTWPSILYVVGRVHQV